MRLSRVSRLGGTTAEFGLIGTTLHVVLCVSAYWQGHPMTSQPGSVLAFLQAKSAVPPFGYMSLSEWYFEMLRDSARPGIEIAGRD